MPAGAGLAVASQLGLSRPAARVKTVRPVWTGRTFLHGLGVSSLPIDGGFLSGHVAAGKSLSKSLDREFFPLIDYVAERLFSPPNGQKVLLHDGI